MSVYVDDANFTLRGRTWCHLTADSETELREFAVRIGLRESWIQRPGTRLAHFDVTPAMCERAVRAGAIPETFRQTGERLRTREGATDVLGS